MLSQESPPANADANLSDGSQSVSPEGLSSRRPNLVVIGAMKASTTSFYQLITRHPEIWFSSEKEPHYFTSPNYGDDSAWRDYLRLFEDAPSQAKFVGEASTGYSKLPHFGNTPQRLKDDLGELRLVYLVRDPVQRTVSNYQHAYLSGHYENGTTLTDALEYDPILIDASCYARQISAYREVFGGESLLVITTDELHASPTRVMRSVEEFLGVSTFDGWESSLPQSNSKQALGGSLALQSMLPKPIFNAVRRIVPSGLRERLKSIASTKAEVPRVTDDERCFVFDRVKDDLRELRGLLGNRLDGWPSVQRLGEG